MKRKKISGSAGALGGVIAKGIESVKGGNISKLRILLPVSSTFALSLLLSAVKAPMGTYPFSYAVLCAATGGAGCAAAFAGAVLATTLMDTGALWQVLILSAILAVRFAVCFFKGDLREKSSAFRRIFRERGYIRTVTAAAGAAVFGCITIIESESIYYGLFSALLGIGEATLASAAFIFFADKGAQKSKRLAGLWVLWLGISMALEGFGLPFSLGAVFAFFSAVYFSFSGGAALGCVVGIAAGLAVGGEYAAAFGCVGIVCALMAEYAKVGAVVTSALCATVLALFGGGLDALSDCLPEIALAAAVAAPLAGMGVMPASLPAFLDIEGERYGEAASFVRGERYTKIGDALEGLSKMLREISDKMRLPGEKEANRICSAARAKHCSGCIHERECAGREAQTVDSMFSNMAFRLTQNGHVTARIVPESVARRCFNIDSILESINRGARKGASLSGGAKKSEIFASDYSAVADLLRAVSEDDKGERDPEAEKLLSRELSACGFVFSSSSVWGKRSRRVYMRGVDPTAAGAGERDIRKCAERVLGARLSSPEFSIDGKHISASMHSVPAIRLRSGRYSVQSKRDFASGDSLCAFENSEGYYYALVSDGMGSGREAALTSGISAAFLEKLLSAGCPMRSALELLNCFVRGSEGECFTTVDLMEADLYTGKARFIKSGAAPSFIIRNGQLYRIHSKTVPVGIMRALDAEAVSFELLCGDTVIMMSDGVTGSYEECPWLYELLSDGLDGIETLAGIARTIAEAAAENTGREDDITVCVMKVEAA